VCFSREIMWLWLHCARAEQEGWAAAVAKLLLNLSRCSYFFPHCCDSNFTFTHTHCLLAAGYLSHSRGARYLGARSLCTLKPSTNNTHPAATVYVLHFAPLVHTCSAFFLFHLQYNGRNTRATPFCVATFCREI
jgi:hypothetical protein